MKGKKNTTIMLQILYTTAQDYHTPHLVLQMPVRKDVYTWTLKLMIITNFNIRTTVHL